MYRKAMIQARACSGRKSDCKLAYRNITVELNLNLNSQSKSEIKPDLLVETDEAIVIPILNADMIK